MKEFTAQEAKALADSNKIVEKMTRKILRQVRKSAKKGGRGVILSFGPVGPIRREQHKIIAKYGSRAKALYFTFLFIIYIIYFYIINGNICFHLATLQGGSFPNGNFAFPNGNFIL